MALHEDDTEKVGAKRALDRHYNEGGAADAGDDTTDDEGEQLPTGAAADADEDRGGEGDGQPDEQQRDDAGDGQDDGEGEQGEGDADGEGDRPAGEQGAPGGAAGAEGDEAFTPLTFRAGGRVWEIPGAVIASDGAYIPIEKVPEVVAAIQRGVYHNTVYRQELAAKDAEIARLSPEFSEKVQAANALLDYLEPYLKDEEGARNLLEHFAHHKARMGDAIALATARAKSAMLEKHPHLGQPAAKEPTEQEFVELASRALWEHFDDVLDRGQFRGVFPAEQRKLLETEIGRNARNYITTADRDYPDDGIKKGDKAIDLPRLVEDIQRYAERSGRVRPAATPASKAAKRNAGARRQVRSPQAGATREPAKGAPAREPRNRREYDASIAQLVRDEMNDRRS